MSDSEFQPLEGDPDILRTKATHYAAIADAITRSVTTLHKISEVDQMTSKATEKLKDKAEEVSKDIDKARDRYAVTAKALLAYSSALRGAQDDARAAITRIGHASDSATQAQHAATSAQQKADDSQKDPTNPDAATDKTAAAAAQQTATSANADLAAARRDWHTALDAKNSAANSSISAIIDVVDGSKNHGLKDGFWDTFGSFVSALYDALKVVCKWAAILSIFLSWVPGLGEVLLALAAIGAIIDLIEVSVAFAQGKSSFGDLLLAAGGAVLTVFGGKLIEMAAKGIKGVMVARAADQIVSTGTRGERGLARIEGVGRHDPSFMSSTAANTAKADLNSAVSSFSGFRSAAMDAFKNSMDPAREGDSMSTIFKLGVKDAFSPRGMLNRDLTAAWRLGLRHPSLLDTKLVVGGLGVTALQGGKDLVGVMSQAKDHSIPGAGDGFGKIFKMGETVKSSVEAVENFRHIN
jgi:hypothetical protein